MVLTAFKIACLKYEASPLRGRRARQGRPALVQTGQAGGRVPRAGGGNNYNTNI